ncbi:hypothetical protein [Spirillospora sp. CA-128828]|uniref:hypothetical protein n=1 Tax=Spirillospora sp. CA-128828 TaxID=3240033 RepID=UPI003D901E41
MTDPHEPPTYQDDVPSHLKTAGQLHAAGLRPCDASAPAGWWVQTFAGDRWRTELYDMHAARPLGRVR